ncbi:DUF2341 domain-containing protein [Thermococcus sp.]|uniref:DUF2341 domain-containing protein n=1 Tax=Thermococcus sp. TaxID=35749 RepID=UPI0026180F2B|nr:DUF2341 domain-containing protein [Thermococcus sp.]
MRKVFMILIVVLFIMGTAGVTLKDVHAEIKYSEKTIFFDDFEGYPLGSYPSSNWILDYDGAGEEYQKIVSNPVKSGSKAFRMLSAQGCWAAVSEHKFDSDADIIGFEADVWAESYGTEGCGGDKTSVIRVAFWNGNLDSWGRYYADVIFRHNGIAYAYSEGEEHQLTSWKPQTWYHVKVILNRKTNTYDVYINGKLVADDIPVEHSDTENINAIVLTAGHANANVVFDNVRIFEVESSSSSQFQPAPPKTVEYLSPEDLSKWKYYREVTIREQSGQTLENFQVLIELNSDNFDFSKAKPDGSDIRIVDEDGNFLPYWIEEWNVSAKRAKIWTIVPRIPANGEVKLKLYYGNPNAQSRSDGEKVFEFFDDFNGNQLDTGKWEPFYGTVDDGYIHIYSESSSKISVGDSILKLYITPSDWDLNDHDVFTRGILSRVGFPQNSVLEAKLVKAHYPDGGGNNGLFVGQFFSSEKEAKGISFRNSVESYGDTYLFFEINKATWDNVVNYGTQVYESGIYQLSRIGSDKWAAKFLDLNRNVLADLGTTEDELSDLRFSLEVANWYEPSYVSAEFDWILVRKYAPKDPVAFVGSKVRLTGSSTTQTTTTSPASTSTTTTTNSPAVTTTSTVTTTTTTTSTLAPIASSAINTAKNVLSKVPSSVDTGDAQTMLDEAQKAYENGDYELAKKFAETAQALAVKSYYDTLRVEVQAKENQGYDVSKARDLLQQAYDAYNSKDYTRALDILLQADKALKAVAPLKGIDYTRYGLYGGVLIGLIGMVAALRRRSSGKKEHLRAEFGSLINSGDNIVDKDPFSALEYYSKAFKVAKGLGEASSIAQAEEKLNTVRGTVTGEINSLLTKGDTVLKKGDYDKALAYYREALSLAEKLHDQRKGEEIQRKMENVHRVRRIRELTSEGDVLMEQEKYSEALKKYKEALSIAKELGDAYFIELLKGRTSKANEVVESINREVSSLVAEAERAMMDEDYESAREKLSQAIVLAEKIGGTVSVEEIKEKLEEAKARKELNEKLKVARESKDYSKALSLYREALRLAQQLGDERIAAQINSEVREVEKAHLLETLRKGIELILPREIPYGRESTLSINVENKLDVPIENLTIDLSELSAYFTMETESVTFPPIKPGRRLGKDIRITPQFKGDFDFSVKISSNIGETAKSLKIKVGDYYSPAQFTPKPLTPKAAPEELSALYDDFQYIGEGGFARVFKAKRKRDGKVVAVKVPKTLDPATGKAFVREISNWLHLKHPNIVELYDVNVIPIPYLEMEYCEGSLARLGKPMDVERASQIVFNIAEGLKYAHAKRIIHRDLKPSNILLKSGIPKISDWGLSKVMSESRSSTLSSFTPYYASPEQLSPRRFGGTDERTDIWQLGVLFYELVTGKLPFEGRDLGEVTYAIINEEPVPPGQLNPEAKAVEPIIMKMLAKRKEERYASVAELQRDLAEILNMTYVEGLRKSTDLKRTVFYIGDLALINLKAGNTAEALKYLLELRDYAGRYGRDLDNLIEQVKLAVEEGVKLGEEAVVKADVIVHQIKMGR